MNILKSIAIIFFNFIDNYIHQNRILYFLKKNKVYLQTFIDVGAHKGSYTDFLRNNFKIKKAYLFEPQKKYLCILKKNIKIIRIYKRLIALYLIKISIKKFLLISMI